MLYKIVRIRTRCGLCTNSYNFLYELYSTNSYNKRAARAARGEAQAARAKPEHTSCPDQAAPGCPDIRVHPAAPTLGYTRLPRPVRVRSWGGWVRNGIKITIHKSGLYDFTRMAYSQPLLKIGKVSSCSRPLISSPSRPLISQILAIDGSVT
jgi:hypothetical protein